jgi:hypothetical protein
MVERMPPFDGCVKLIGIFNWLDYGRYRGGTWIAGTAFSRLVAGGFFDQSAVSPYCF